FLARIAVQRPLTEREGRYDRAGHAILALDRDPLAVVTPRDVQVRAVAEPALARGMPQPVARLDSRAGRDDLMVVDVQVDDRPAGRLVAVAVQVKDHITVPAARDHPRRDGRHPVGRDVARPLQRDQLVGWPGRRKVHRAPGGTAIVRAVRPTGVYPFLATRERER